MKRSAREVASRALIGLAPEVGVFPPALPVYDIREESEGEPRRSEFRAIYPGSGREDYFVLNPLTHAGRWEKPGVCRDDRDLNQHFLRPAAIALGIYRQGLGFHAFPTRSGDAARADDGVSSNAAHGRPRDGGHDATLHARRLRSPGTISARVPGARARLESCLNRRRE
jgi:hypothetical protein